MSSKSKSGNDCLLEQLQLSGDTPDISVLGIVGAHEGLAAQDVEDRVVAAFTQAQECIRKFFALRRIHVFAGNPDVVDKRFRCAKYANLAAIQFFLGKHRPINSLIERARIDSSGFHRLRCRGMAAGIAELHIVIDIYAGFFQFGIRDQVTAGRIDIAERKTLPFYVSQSFYRRSHGP